MLNGIEKALANQPSQFLLELQQTLMKDYILSLKDEEEFWALKSRLDWLMKGERNTRFFHASIVIRRSYNKIFGLMNGSNGCITDQNSIKSTIQDHFVSLYTTSHSFDYLHLVNGPLSIATLSNDDHFTLLLPISDLEIQKTVWSLKPYKAPGTDGLYPFFFQKCWDTIRSKFCSEIHTIFASGCLPPNFCDTLISLIPKIQSPSKIDQFRPISLCNFPYKVITKILVNRLRHFLSKIISPY